MEDTKKITNRIVNNAEDATICGLNKWILMGLVIAVIAIIVLVFVCGGGNSEKEMQREIEEALENL